MSSRQDVVEKMFFLMLQHHYSNMLSPEFQSRKTTDRESVNKALTSELSKIKAQLEKIHTLLEQGVYDIDTFLHRRTELTNQETSLREKLEQSCRDSNDELILQRLENVLERYWDGLVIERNQIIKSAVSKASYSKPKAGGWNSTPTIEITEWRE
jgi:hypothetical protein